MPLMFQTYFLWQIICRHFYVTDHSNYSAGAKDCEAEKAFAVHLSPELETALVFTLA
jgi:hypothetical protein